MARVLVTCPIGIRGLFQSFYRMFIARKVWVGATLSRGRELTFLLDCRRGLALRLAARVAADDHIGLRDSLKTLRRRVRTVLFTGPIWRERMSFVKIGTLRGLNVLPKVLRMGGRIRRVVRFRQMSGLETRRKLGARSRSLRVIFAKDPNAKGAATTQLIKRTFTIVNVLGSRRGNDAGVPFVRVRRTSIADGFMNSTRGTVGGGFGRTENKIIFVSRTCTFVSKNSGRGSSSGIITTVIRLVRSLERRIVIVTTNCSTRVKGFLSSGPKLQSHFSGAIRFPSCSIPSVVHVTRAVLASHSCQPSGRFLSVLTGELQSRGSGGKFNGTEAIQGVLRRSVQVRSIEISRVPSPGQRSLDLLAGLSVRVPRRRVLSRGRVLRGTVRRVRNELFRLRLGRLATNGLWIKKVYRTGQRGGGCVYDEGPRNCSITHPGTMLIQVNKTLARNNT